MKLGWRTILVAALVALAIGGAVLWLGTEPVSLALLGRRLELERPLRLLVLLLLPSVTLAVGVSLTDQSRLRRGLAAIVRLALLFALAVALARPTLVTERADVSVVVLVDVSTSMADSQLEAARRWIDAARQARTANDSLKVVLFADRPRVLALPDDAASPTPTIARSGGKSSETNLAAAIELSRSLHPPGTVRRVVLFSDGNQTMGDALAALADAERVPLSYANLTDTIAPEVLVQSVRLPPDVRIGAPFEVEAEVYANRPGAATVTLLRDGLVNPFDGQKKLQLVAGKNLVRWKSEVPIAGTTVFRAEVKTDAADRFPENNAAVAAVTVRGRPHILYIEGEPASAVHLRTALAKSDIEVEVRPPYSLPRTAKELDAYDLVILSDTKAAFVGPDQMAALESYVKDLGGGFIMAGGENSFGSGGYQGTTIERLLPVRFDAEKKRDQPTLALALVIDRSGSMSGERIVLAKEAARATAEVLSNDDLISVIAFDTTPIALVRLQRASNRMRIASEISRLQAGGGTSILPALREAFVQLDQVQAKVKHVILLTDGKASYDGIRQLVDQMTERRITVSAVGIGSDTDKTLLTMVAERGNGRFYYTDDAQSIPRIFLKETSQVARSSLVETPSAIRVLRKTELLDGINLAEAPPLLGYASTRVKPLSEPILAIGEGEPLLVRWRYGLGQAVVWTSDVKNRWAARWLGWPGYARFFSQLVRSTMRPQASGSGLPAYELALELDPPNVHVRVDAIDRNDQFVSGLTSSLEVIDPTTKQRVREVRLDQTGPGRYEATFALPRYGSFVARARQSRDGRLVAETPATFALPYPREFLALPINTTLLEQLRESSGGQRLTVGGAADAAAAKAIFDPRGEHTRAARPLWPQLIWLAIALLLLDLLLRRLPDAGGARSLTSRREGR